MLAHFLRAGGAVQPQKRDAERLDHGGDGGDIGSDQQCAGGFDGYLNEDGGVGRGAGARFLDRIDGGLDLQRVLAGLDQDRVHAARDQPVRLGDQAGFQAVVIDMAQ